MAERFHCVAKLRQLSLLAILLLSWLLPAAPAVARCYNPAAIASRLEEQLREEQPLMAKSAYTGVFDPGEKVQIGLLRWYDPNLQRWINRDPMGEASDLNLYRFVANSPINLIDPLGLLTAVIVGGPSPASPGYPSRNPFGHIAIATTGNGVYSFGTPTPFGSNLTDYLKQQATYRDSTIYILNTTPDQEKAINDYLRKQTGKPISRFPDNCAARVNGGLKAGGIDLTMPGYGEQLFMDATPDNFPFDIERGLIHSTDNVAISVPKGSVLPPKFLIGFNPRR